MLQRLFIQNYAIIDEIEIQFSGSLNIITGETGAGKSIIMGALSLLLGYRADPALLFTREKKCIIEGSFFVKNKLHVKLFLESNDLDAGDELLLRREIRPNGKSRAFINDTPVNLEQLRELTSDLIDLHRQFDTQELTETGFQREVIDALADNYNLLDNYRAAFGKWRSARQKLDELKNRKLQFTRELDYNQYLLDELKEADFKENELEELDAELKLQSNAETIKTTLSDICLKLSSNEYPLVQQLKTIAHQLHPFIEFQKELPQILERMNSARIELDEISSDLEKITDDIQFDPGRIEFINERISLGYRLFRKHNVNTTGQLIMLRDGLQAKLKAVLNIDEEINNEEKIEIASLEQARSFAEELFRKRSGQLKKFEAEVNRLLTQVGMPNAKLKVEIKQDDSLHENGMDTIEFLFDANRSDQYLPVRKVASGGELSRLMLCIKSLVAKKIDLPSLMFDEIDSGISGEAAKQVGLIMKDLSVSRQLICITHQPQIAGMGDTHLFVYKEISGKAAKTNIKILSQAERITTIAKMLSGEKPTAAALQNAREMVMN